MTVVKKLLVQNIRSHDKFEIKLSPGVTVITGGNGSGKTSLLEALYAALQGASFRGSDSDMLKYGAPWWRIELELDSHSKRGITFDPGLESGSKKFNIDEKAVLISTELYVAYAMEAIKKETRNANNS